MNSTVLKMTRYSKGLAMASILVFMMTSSHVKAQMILGGQLQGIDIEVNQTVQYVDPICNSFDVCEQETSSCGYQTFVQLVVDPLNENDNAFVDQSIYTLEIEYDLFHYTISGQVQADALNPHSISVDFTNGGQTVINNALNSYSHKYYLDARIIEVVVLKDDTPIMEMPPSSATFQLGAIVNRYKPLPDVLPENSKISYATDGSFIFMNFTDVPEAIGYDLEWTWIDDEQVGDIEYNFKHNSTRVNISEPNYKIANTYRKGFIYARYRAIGYRGEGKKSDCSTLQYTNWNIEPNKGEFIPLNTNNLAISGHFDELNWQHSRSYAEEGKSKDIINYFDGSMRSRQTVSKIESEDHSIFAETVYDHVGRPAIQILPSPTEVKNSSIGYLNKIKFVENLNKNWLGKSYSWKDFELGNDCENAISPLRNESGAGKYYSRNNNVDSDSEQDYIPAAQGYPLAHTVYTQDGTGRVRIQGGVGVNHQAVTTFGNIENKHATKYFYGVPAQTELDRLFGNEAGYSKYYRKNLIVDPNGQATISYLDNKNRVIANALAGENPDQLESLLQPDENPFFNVDDNLIPNNHLSMDGSGIPAFAVDHQFVISSENSDFDLAYSFEQLDYTDDSCAVDICFDCEYEVSLAVSGDCATQYISLSENVGNEQILFENKLPICSEGNSLYTFEDDDLFGVGNYSVNKLLRLNAEKLKEYEEIYVKHYNCQISELEIFNLLLLQADFSGCIDSLCAADYIAQNPYNGFEDLESYKEAILEHLETCEPNTIESQNQCELLYEGILSDVSPYGQYGEISIDEETGIVSNDDNNAFIGGHPCLSIFYTTNKLPNDNTEQALYRTIPILDGDGNDVLIEIGEEMIPPHELSVADYVTFFEPFWAEQLAELHPEYDAWVWCSSDPINSIYDYEIEFLEVESLIDDEGNDLSYYLNPTNINPSIISDLNGINIPANPDNIDPIVQLNSDIDLLNLYTAQSYELSIWHLAYITAIGNHIDLELYLTSHSIGDLFLETFCYNEQLYWEAFRNLYVQLYRNPSLKIDLVADLNTDILTFLESLGTINFGCSTIENTNVRTILLYSAPTHTFDVDLTDISQIPGLETDINEDFEMQIAEECASTCAAYRDDWRASLLPCIGEDADEDKVEELLDIMEGICRLGCDVDHILGSSSTPAGIEYLHTDGTTFENFKEAFGYFNFSTSSDICYPSLINAPLPYTNDIFAGEMPFIDDCVCDNYLNIYEKYEASLGIDDVADLDGFIIYLQEFYAADYGKESIADIDCACNSNSEYLLETPVSSRPIPYPFVCVTCLDCNQLTYQIQFFYLRNPEYRGLTTEELLSDKKFRNEFSNFVNDELQFNLSFNDYYDFFEYCGEDLGYISDFFPGSKVGDTGSGSEAQKGKNSTSKRSSVTLDYDLQIEVNQNPIHPSDDLEIEVTIYNYSDEQLDEMYFYVGNSASWRFSGYPTLTYNEDLQGGTYDPWINGPVQSIGDFSIEANSSFQWHFKIHVDDYIVTNGHYDIIGGITGTPFTLDSQLNDTATVFVTIEDPCLGAIEEAPDMVTFLNEIQEQFPANGECTEIALQNVEAFNSSINLWPNIPFENQTLQICSVNADDDGLTDDYTLSFFNVCDNTVGCEIVFYDLDIEEVAEFSDIREDQELNIEMHYSLELEYINANHGGYISTGGSSSCYSFLPCERRRLCNDSYSIPGELPESDCTESLLDFLEQQTTEEYEEILDDAREYFRENYVLQCMDKEALNEQLNISYTNKEHHYTLYYYDQSGTLVQTIPPKGVLPIQPSELDEVAAHRANPSNPIKLPDHIMPTTYDYNSFGGLATQDSPDADSIAYWYDKLGRVVLSQDGRQRALAFPTEVDVRPSNTYSYSLYDDLGRIEEIGEVDLRRAYPSHLETIEDYSDFKDFILTRRIRRRVVRTIYDVSYVYTYSQNNTSIVVDIDQHFGVKYQRPYLRKRISSLLFFENLGGRNTLYDYAMHYDYDVHGNVKTLIQEYRELQEIDQNLKRLDYDYDLISGNVKMVKYQEGKLDEFYHKYKYDGENRLISAKTSHNKIIWDEDVGYHYYDHGPLARTEIGEYAVQGQDHIYSLHGWIKGVNSNSLQREDDPGHDGYMGSTSEWEENSYTAADAYSYSLDYYESDYIPIRVTNTVQATNPPAMVNGGLYNANIKRMTTSLRDLNFGIVPITPNEYTYDQLQRITSMTKFKEVNPFDFKWNDTQIEDYKTKYSYDANGNILYLNRNDETQSIDELRYNYKPETNLLEKINDNAGVNSQIGDIGDRTFYYDASGNLISDPAEEIDKIVWDQYGKIREIIREENTDLSEKPNIGYRYDGMGNRIVKIVKRGEKPDTWTNTYYVRDASGNVMATYDGKYKEKEIRQLYEKEYHIYGLARLGIKVTDFPDRDLAELNLIASNRHKRFAGNRKYELSNHLGNVLSVVSDHKLLRTDGDGVSLYKPDIVRYSDYYPFGWTMPGRAKSDEGYRYGFNGKEMDDDVKGSGVQYDYGFRVYDSRIGRFMSVDPLTSDYSFYTPFQFAGNKPIMAIDLDGLEDLVVNVNSYDGDDQIISVEDNVRGGGLVIRRKYFYNDEFLDEEYIKASASDFPGGWPVGQERSDGKGWFSIDFDVKVTYGSFKLPSVKIMGAETPSYKFGVEGYLAKINYDIYDSKNGVLDSPSFSSVFTGDDSRMSVFGISYGVGVAHNRYYDGMKFKKSKTTINYGVASVNVNNKGEGQTQLKFGASGALYFGGSAYVTFSLNDNLSKGGWLTTIYSDTKRNEMQIDNTYQVIDIIPDKEEKEEEK